MAIFFNRFRTGERAKVFGDGRQTRDYLHVWDIVDATLAGRGKEGGLQRRQRPRDIVLELHELCRRASGTEGEPEFAPERLGEIQRSVLDPTRGVDELGWRARLSLDEGLRATWRLEE